MVSPASIGCGAFSFAAQFRRQITPVSPRPKSERPARQRVSL
ncbi:unnamed protein product, partial [Scytosiphon promiscuus]